MKESVNFKLQCKKYGGMTGSSRNRNVKNGTLITYIILVRLRDTQGYVLRK